MCDAYVQVDYNRVRQSFLRQLLRWLTGNPYISRALVHRIQGAGDKQPKPAGRIRAVTASEGKFIISCRY